MKALRRPAAGPANGNATTQRRRATPRLYWRTARWQTGRLSGRHKRTVIHFEKVARRTKATAAVAVHRTNAALSAVFVFELAELFISERFGLVFLLLFSYEYFGNVTE